MAIGALEENVRLLQEAFARSGSPTIEALLAEQRIELLRRKERQIPQAGFVAPSERELALMIEHAYGREAWIAREQAASVFGLLTLVADSETGETGEALFERTIACIRARFCETQALRETHALPEVRALPETPAPTRYAQPAPAHAPVPMTPA